MSSFSPAGRFAVVRVGTTHLDFDERPTPSIKSPMRV